MLKMMRIVYIHCAGGVAASIRRPSCRPAALPSCRPSVSLPTVVRHPSYVSGANILYHWKSRRSTLFSRSSPSPLSVAQFLSRVI